MQWQVRLITLIILLQWPLSMGATYIKWILMCGLKWKCKILSNFDRGQTAGFEEVNTKSGRTTGELVTASWMPKASWSDENKGESMLFNSHRISTKHWKMIARSDEESTEFIAAPCIATHVLQCPCRPLYTVSTYKDQNWTLEQQQKGVFLYIMWTAGCVSNLPGGERDSGGTKGTGQTSRGSVMLWPRFCTFYGDVTMTRITHSGSTLLQTNYTPSWKQYSFSLYQLNWIKDLGDGPIHGGSTLQLAQLLPSSWGLIAQHAFRSLVESMTQQVNAVWSEKWKKHNDWKVVLMVLLLIVIQAHINMVHIMLITQ